MSNYSSDDIGNYASVFSALSNPHRLQIYTLLSGCCTPGSRCDIDAVTSCCVGDLGNELDIAASTLSHHLKELSHAGLINMQRQGKQIICSVNPDMLNAIRQFFHTNTEITDEPETSR